MNVLVIGGSGLVGSMITPYLNEGHTLRIFDLKPPKDTTIDHYKGDVTNYEQLLEAVQGMNALVYMAMGRLEWDTLDGITSAFDVNVKGLHLALKAAHDTGITQAVYTSSMSVYADLGHRKFPDEYVVPDEHHLYGFTKRLGEQVCLKAWRSWGMNVNALRLCFPTPDDELEGVDADKQLLATRASDVANAIKLALNFQGGFQAFMISGDDQNTMLNMSKAKNLLGWSPTPK